MKEPRNIEYGRDGEVSRGLSPWQATQYWGKGLGIKNCVMEEEKERMKEGRRGLKERGA